jgi:hypothetical protein
MSFHLYACKYTGRLNGFSWQLVKGRGSMRVDSQPLIFSIFTVFAHFLIFLFIYLYLITTVWLSQTFRELCRNPESFRGFSQSLLADAGISRHRHSKNTHAWLVPLILSLSVWSCFPKLQYIGKADNFAHLPKVTEAKHLYPAQQELAAFRSWVALSAEPIRNLRGPI